MDDPVSSRGQQDYPDHLSGFRPLAGEPNPFEDLPDRSPMGSYAREYPLDGFATERELADRVLERLEPWFVVRREVYGTHCFGARLRIDAMLRPRDAHAWRNPDVAFGVEFKVPRLADGLKTYAKWVAQAVDYTYVDWDGYGRRIVLTCPGVIAAMGGYQGTRDGDGDLLVAKRLMGQLGVGELVLRWGYGLTVLVNDGRVWSERGGVGCGKHWNLNIRSGSR
ncbi:hypothetical protein ABZV14_14915 [Streptosporangium canum]|uniref:hypothetical protein n=1 Tax=Streptosporangium canum TaxID=324952 RepID=UPI0033AEE08F